MQYRVLTKMNTVDGSGNPTVIIRKSPWYNDDLTEIVKENNKKSPDMYSMETRV